MGIYTKLFVAVACALGIVNAQIPSFGGCPDYPAMKSFDKEQFLGTWYEIERYFTVSEIGAKCITATYEKRPDGRIYVNNAFTNRLTGVQRIISGTMKETLKSNNGEGIYNIRYNALPVAYDTTLRVLETDYQNFAIIWSCNSIGSLGHTESVWVMARNRIPPGSILQQIYGVLDKFKISRTFFVETDQKNCETIAPPVEAEDPENIPENSDNELRSESIDNILAPGQTAKTVLIAKETIRNFMLKTNEAPAAKKEELIPVVIVEAVQPSTETKKPEIPAEPVITVMAEPEQKSSPSIIESIPDAATIIAKQTIETIPGVQETEATLKFLTPETQTLELETNPSPALKAIPVIETEPVSEIFHSEKDAVVALKTVPEIQSQQTIVSTQTVSEPEAILKTIAEPEVSLKTIEPVLESEPIIKSEPLLEIIKTETIIATDGEKTEKITVTVKEIVEESKLSELPAKIDSNPEIQPVIIITTETPASTFTAEKNTEPTLPEKIAPEMTSTTEADKPIELVVELEPTKIVPESTTEIKPTEAALPVTPTPTLETTAAPLPVRTELEIKPTLESGPIKPLPIEEQKSINAIEEAVKAIKEADNKEMPVKIAHVGAVKSGATRTTLKTEEGTEETKPIAAMARHISMHRL